MSESNPGRMSSPAGRLRHGIALCLVVGALAACVRAIDHRCLPTGGGGWFTTDPDSLYQTRRVARALDEGRIAGTDAFLNHPEGSAIPWPPYYTALLGRTLGPFAPDEPDARRAFLERGVATVPLAFGALTSAAVAAFAFALGGWPAGLFAGLYHATCEASVAYSKLGNGDHHAWIALCWILVLGAIGRAAGGLDEPSRCARWGLAAGALAGVALGSWVAALILIVLVDLSLGLLIVAHAVRARPGLGALATSFHAAALVAVLPAVLASPWPPWDVVNLSWFHVAYLTAGLVVVLPLLGLRGDRARRAYPFVALALLAALALGLVFGDFAAGRGVRQGFAWAGRTNAFMARVGESRALFDDGWVAGLGFVGYGAALLPFALVFAFRRALGGRLELVPFAVAALVGALQATRQMRFADVLAPLVALLVGVLAAALCERLPARRRAGVGIALALSVLALAANAPALARVARRLAPGGPGALAAEAPARVAAREACEWLRTVDGPGAVLSSWRFGHVIEWGAERPSIATNFGSYVGEAGFRAPAEVFMSEDPAAAERVLAQRDARFVLVTSELPGELHALIETAVPESFGRYATFTGPRGGRIEEPWFRTLGARLLFGGHVRFGEPAAPLGFLRLVHRSARRVPSGFGVPIAAAQVWERVAGARVVGRGRPGDVLSIELRIAFPGAREPLLWSVEREVGESGAATVRVPYATLGRNGDAEVRGSAWSLAGRRGALAISDEDVRAGREVELR